MATHSATAQSSHNHALGNFTGWISHVYYITGFLQERRNSVANALELLYFCPNSATYQLPSFTLLGGLVVDFIMIQDLVAHKFSCTGGETLQWSTCFNLNESKAISPLCYNYKWKIISEIILRATRLFWYLWSVVILKRRIMKPLGV